MQFFGKRLHLLLIGFLWSSSAFGLSDSISIQGRLIDGQGEPLVGTRAYRIQFFDSAENGTNLGAAINGFVTVGASGRFSIELVPPPEALDAADLFYELGVDSAVITDGIVNPGDVFPERVHVTSVPAAHTVIRQGPGSGLDADMLDGIDSSAFAGASHSHNLQDLSGAVTDAQVPNNITVDHAATADMAMTLSGQLTDPGDQIPLGGGLVLQVAEDGTVEFLTGGQRLRLAGQKWFDPKNLLDNISPDGTDADVPQVAMNNNGEAIIVWQQVVGANQQIFRTEYRDGSWTDPVDISPDGQNARFPQVALNDSGDAVIVWSQSDGSKLQIFRSEYTNGLWTDPADLSDNISPNGQDATFSQIALNDVGEAVIVWQQSDGTKSQVFRSERRNGSWTDPASLLDNISPDLSEAFEPDVAVDNAGIAVIVWRQNDGAKEQVFRSEYRNGLWTDPSSVSDNISPDGTDAAIFGAPQVALDNNDEAVIVWEQSDGSKDQIFRSEYRNGTWIDPSSLSDNISPDGLDAIFPQVALSDNGEAVIVWQQSDGTFPQIFRSEYRNGSWVDPTGGSDNISPDGTRADVPQVAMNNNGEAIIVWQQVVGANQQIFRTEYRDGSWTDPVDISPNGQDAVLPQVALNNNWDAVIVWQQSDGMNIQIFRSEFRFGF